MEGSQGRVGGGVMWEGLLLLPPIYSTMPSDLQVSASGTGDEGRQGGGAVLGEGGAEVLPLYSPLPADLQVGGGARD